MDLVSDAIGGREAGQVIRGNERYNINVRLVREARASAKSIRSLILEAPTGAWVRLGDVASVTIESGQPQIRRDDVQRRMVMPANVTGRDMGGLVRKLSERVSTEIDLPPGYSAVFGGQFENQQRAAGTHWRLCSAVFSRAVPVGAGLHRVYRPVRCGRTQWCGDGHRH